MTLNQQPGQRQKALEAVKADPDLSERRLAEESGVGKGAAKRAKDAFKLFQKNHETQPAPSAPASVDAVGATLKDADSLAVHRAETGVMAEVELPRKEAVVHAKAGQRSMHCRILAVQNLLIQFSFGPCPAL